ncbi:hypothetical protein R6Q57_010716 [Mikania cordata]
MVGKYTGPSDSYLYVLKALLHASVACKWKLVINWVSSSDLEDETTIEVIISPSLFLSQPYLLFAVDAVVVPGGFGDRGVEGKIIAAKYARENNIPYLGICLGMQIVVIEYARSVLGLKNANNTEFDPNTKNPCGSKTHMGGTMRLGSRRTYFHVTDCKSAKLYGNQSFIDERHRHRYEIVELQSHPYFVGVQFHPEFKSRPGKPSAVFLGLIAAACGQFDALLKKSVGAKEKGYAIGKGVSGLPHHRYGNMDVNVAVGSFDGIYQKRNGLHV